MALEATYTQARANLAKLCDAAAKDLEVVIITRRGAEDVALVSAAELRSLRETAHLLRSPRNADRLLKALGRPEPLRHLAPNTWSRRATQEHRLVYFVSHDRIDFLQARYHY